ncbi:hypothetical protein E4T44_13854 [Aureobasidium sp. EXF-8845]|nr:hypothetical protein E4T44_13854 [Aureobasidium sp. EXF-8845]KAI4847648.1 hypothetical protein E4T45_06678 [Aureobasidium sp. EXF-8846]
MPHKHRRRDDNAEDFNLPPTAVAKPLPVGKNAQTVFTSDGKKKRKTEKNVYKFDDTPKAFARLMYRAQPTSTPDESESKESKTANKKRKRQEDIKQKQKQKGTTMEMPKIQPGEKLRDFNARVDQTLPVTGLARKGNQGLAPGEKVTRTKTEKRMHKMYDEWRKEDQRIKDKAEEAQEKREEDEEERNALYGEDSGVPTVYGKKRQRMIGESKDSDDIWAVLKTKRDKPKGLHDVAQAPPQFTVVPREKFKVKNGARADVADVPNAAGSLARREELGAERRNIIERYRAMSKASAE